MKQSKTARAGRTAQGGEKGNYEAGHPHSNTTHTAAQAPRPIHTADGKKVCGTVTGDTFRKRAQGSKHMLQKPRGWALDAPVLDELRKLGVQTVTIADTETGITYAAPLAEFAKHGVTFNRGFGAQVALPVGYWAVDGKPPRLSAPPQPNPDAPRQLSLFAEIAAP